MSATFIYRCDCGARRESREDKCPRCGEIPTIGNDRQVVPYQGELASLIPPRPN